MAQKKNNSLACITLLNYMQDDLLIEYEVYQIAHEMWQALKEKYDGLSATKLKELVMKFGTEPYNRTTSQRDEKNDKSLRHPGMSSLMSSKLRRSSNLY